MIAEPPAPAVTPGRMSIREYFSSQPDHYSKTDAKRIGPELERLAVEGKSKPREIVEAARPVDAPLHRYFEWDDRRAAEGFRQLQAGRMARTIMVYTAASGQERREPAFCPITVRTVAHAAPVTSGAATTVGAPLLPMKVPGSAAVGVSVQQRGLKAPATVPVTVKPGVSKAPDERDDRLIERAFTQLREWETTFVEARARAPFESIFAPVFAAIGEARERAGE